jgi:hypothetical protein
MEITRPLAGVKTVVFASDEPAKNHQLNHPGSGKFNSGTIPGQLPKIAFSSDPIGQLKKAKFLPIDSVFGIQLF